MLDVFYAGLFRCHPLDDSRLLPYLIIYNYYNIIIKYYT